MRILKIVFVIIGIISLGLGIIGVILPILPTTPFLILSSICFFKGSDRCHSYFIKTKIYKKYVSDFTEKKGLSLKRKLTILVFADILIVISMLIIRNLYMNIVLLGIILFKFWYFIFKVKTIPSSELENNINKNLE